MIAVCAQLAGAGAERDISASYYMAGSWIVSLSRSAALIRVYHFLRFAWPSRVPFPASLSRAPSGTHSKRRTGL
jgi:hypothetical protein